MFARSQRGEGRNQMKPGRGANRHDLKFRIGEKLREIGKRPDPMLLSQFRSPFGAVVEHRVQRTSGHGRDGVRMDGGDHSGADDSKFHCEQRRRALGGHRKARYARSLLEFRWSLIKSPLMFPAA